MQNRAIKEMFSSTTLLRITKNHEVLRRVKLPRGNNSNKKTYREVISENEDNDEYKDKDVKEPTYF